MIGRAGSSLGVEVGLSRAEAHCGVVVVFGGPASYLRLADECSEMMYAGGARRAWRARHGSPATSNRVLSTVHTKYFQ